MPRATSKAMAPKLMEDVKSGRIAEGRVAEAQLALRTIRLTVLHPEDGGHDGKSLVSVSLPRGHNSFSLTAMTHEEWRAAKLLFDLAFELAEPLCIALDKDAREAWERGDDTHSRSYRALPVFFIRAGVLAKNYGGIPLRSGWIKDLVGRYNARAEGLGRVRGGNSQVLNDEPAELGAQDDAAESGDVQDVRETPGGSGDLSA